MAAGVLTGAFAVSLFVGFEDLDSGTDLLLVALGALDLIACWLDVIRATSS